MSAAVLAAKPTPETTVAGWLGGHPGTAGVFLGRRMACVGCPLAAFETLADAAREYRLPLADFLAELGRAAGAPASDPDDRPSRRDPS